MVVEVIAQFQVTPILLKTHAGTVVVGASILGGNGARELSTAYLVGNLGLQGSIAACADIDICMNRIATCRATRYNIDDTTHRIRTIEHRGWSAQHFHAFSHQRLITVGNGMAIDALILWMTIDQHHHLTTAACYTAHVNTSGGSS